MRRLTSSSASRSFTGNLKLRGDEFFILAPIARWDNVERLRQVERATHNKLSREQCDSIDRHLGLPADTTWPRLASERYPEVWEYWKSKRMEGHLEGLTTEENLLIKALRALNPEIAETFKTRADEPPWDLWEQTPETPAQPVTIALWMMLETTLLDRDLERIRVGQALAEAIEGFCRLPRKPRSDLIVAFSASVRAVTYAYTPAWSHAAVWVELKPPAPGDLPSRGCTCSRSRTERGRTAPPG